MESYIHLYETNSEFTEAYNGPDYKEPWLSLTEEGMKVNYNKPKLTAITFDSITWVADIPATGGTATKDNCSFEVYAKYDNGISVDISSDAVVTGELAVPSSTEGQRHEAGKLTLTASYGGFSATGNVTVYQAAPDFSMSPLTFKISSPGTINWTATDSSVSKTIEYKLNNGEWASITSNMEGAKIEVNPGDKIQFKGNNATYCGGNPESPYNTFGGSTARFEAEGNIMSLINSTNFITATTLNSNFTFSWLFRGCTGLTSAENLILPVTTLTMGCYFSMFNGCTSLTTAPKLPATTLETGCYLTMFQDCTSLTTAPELPATTLASLCYNSMFASCASLTKAPELPATTLANGCYIGMFQDCASLTKAPELPATTLADSCYTQMFNGCASLTKAPKLPAMTLANSCYEYMFYGCTSLTKAPELPATTLTSRCYEYMFYGCTSLATAPELPATSLVDYCYEYMFENCTKLNYIKCLATDISATDCTSNWVIGVASTGTFVKASSMTSWTTGSNGIPDGWTVADNKEPLTFKISSGGTVNWTASDSSVSKTIEYKLNNGEWASITSNTGASAPTITVNSGDKIQFRGNNATYGGYSNRDDYSSFSGSTARFEIEGSIMSLINSTDFVTATTLDSVYTFSYLFNGCTGLTSAENLILPVTTLTNYCYSHMFYGCTSLTTAPELPAMTLVEGCYNAMFYGCTKLNYIKCLATDISATDCTSYWVDRVASTGTFVKNPNMAEWTTGSNGIPTGWTVEEYVDYTKEPLTFKISSPGTINWKASNSSIAKTIEYKLNDSNNWTSITPNMEGVKINVNAGDKIQFRGDNTVYGAYKGYNTFSGSTARFEAEGNIMSLINSTDFVTATTLNNYYTFSRLFSDCTGLTSAENLILPATILMESCYEYMFSYCTSLKTAPALPATRLADSCYSYMFNGCTSLTKAPELSATRLAGSCYVNMFDGCTSLTKAPELPATTLANGCYTQMFNGCASLTKAPELSATRLAGSCYENMFSNCTSLTKAPELPATRLEDYCYLNMFLGCTSLTKAPELPATTLKRMCYQSMFYGCTSLNYIKCLATDISAYNCTNGWVNGVASAGTFVQAGATGWTRGNDGIPNNWTVEKEIVS